MQFDQAFLFKYSQRRDTPAAAMPDQVAEEVIEERHQRLLAEINRMAMAKFEALVGGLVEVLVEGPSHRNPARYEGRTRTNKITVFEGSPGIRVNSSSFGSSGWAASRSTETRPLSASIERLLNRAASPRKQHQILLEAP